MIELSQTFVRCAELKPALNERSETDAVGLFSPEKKKSDRCARTTANGIPCHSASCHARASAAVFVAPSRTVAALAVIGWPAKPGAADAPRTPTGPTNTSASTAADSTSPRAVGVVGRGRCERYATTARPIAIGIVRCGKCTIAALMSGQMKRDP